MSIGLRLGRYSSRAAEQKNYAEADDTDCHLNDKLLCKLLT